MNNEEKPDLDFNKVLESFVKWLFKGKKKKPLPVNTHKNNIQVYPVVQQGKTMITASVHSYGYNHILPKRKQGPNPVLTKEMLDKYIE